MSEERTCPNCGAALMPGDIFCGECGARVQGAVSDVAPDTLPDDVSPETVEESLFEEPDLVVPPAAGEYIPPPPVEQKTSGWTTLRVVAIAVAVGFLFLSLCLCSFGGFALLSNGDDYSTAENVGFAAAICLVPGVISGLLGIGAAYFGLRKQ